MTKLTFKSKNILFATVITILVAITITGINYYMNMQETVNRLTTSSIETVRAWSKEISTEDVEKLVATKDPEIQKHMIAHFNKLNEYQPQVAQAYIFGVELENGTDTSVVSAPTFLMNAFKKDHLYIGDMYTQPDEIAHAIKDMKETEQQTTSKIYTDKFGTWVTVLKPLFDKNGKMFAYYGVDFDANSYLQGEYQKIKTIGIILIILLVIVCLIQYFYMNKLFQPIATLKDGMQKIGDGDYSVRLPESDDEFGELAKQLNSMTKQLQDTTDYKNKHNIKK